jgi:hypothetical protein
MQQEPIVVGNRNKEVHLAIWGKTPFGDSREIAADLR